MSINLLGLLKDQLSGDMVSKIAGAIGESSSTTQSALGSVLPSILAGAVQKASDTNGATALFNMLSSGNHDGSILNNLGSLLGGGSSTQNLISSGAGILSALFGDRVSGVANLISKISGMKSSSASSLLGLAAPIVMGMIGKTVKSQGISNAAGLASMLMGQKDFLKGVLPAGLGSLLNLSSLGDVAGMASSAMAAGGSGMKKLIPWLVLAGAAVLVYSLLGRGCQTDVPKVDVTQKVEEAAKTVDDAASKAVDAMANWFKKTLPNGVALNAPMGGIENQLVEFIEDASKPVDKTTWFNFDRLTFETGKATLDMAKSAEQLNNVAEIMKAYPNVELKIGGYTDNVGSAAANMKLSEERANATMAELVKLGVAAARMKAEGYGDQHPVASNDTEAGRAQNRRIAVRVTKK
jgi:outer membrane protein OmpA-like peptidoglycan-associated protein